MSDVKISSFTDLADAITKLHKEHHLPHIIVTSVQFDVSAPTISIIGSSARRDGSSRIFKIDVPSIDCFFSGTGDMFAALTVAWLRRAVSDQGLSRSKSWLPPDEVTATELPLAKAAEQVLGTMQSLLEKTKTARDNELGKMAGPQGALEKDSEKRLHLRKTKAAEVRLVRNLDILRRPNVRFSATLLEEAKEWNAAKIPRPMDEA